MNSISLVRGYHECTKGPTQPPDTARWIWYKKTDSRTVCEIAFLAVLHFFPAQKLILLK